MSSADLNPPGRPYDKRQWRDVVRPAQLAAHPLCKQCLELGQLIPATEVDHIIPVSEGGSWYEPENLMSLCKACHSVKTRGEQSGQRRHRIKGCYFNGMPRDPNHPWYHEKDEDDENNT